MFFFPQGVSELCSPKTLDVPRGETLSFVSLDRSETKLETKLIVSHGFVIERFRCHALKMKSRNCDILEDKYRRQKVCALSKVVL